MTVVNPAVNMTTVLNRSPRNANGAFTARSGAFNNGSLTLRTNGSGGPKAVTQTETSNNAENSLAKEFALLRASGGDGDLFGD